MLFPKGQQVISQWRVILVYKYNVENWLSSSKSQASKKALFNHDIAGYVGVL